MQESEFLAKCQQNKEFTMKVVGTEKGGLVNNPVCLTLIWKKIFCHAKEIMFFGVPFETTRPFDPFFRQKFNHTYLIHVCTHVAMESWVDANTSS